MTRVLAADRSLSVRAIRDNLARVLRRVDPDRVQILRLLEEARRQLAGAVARGTEFDARFARQMQVELERALQQFTSGSTPAMTRSLQQVIAAADAEIVSLSVGALGEGAGIVPTVDPVLLDFASQNSVGLVTQISERVRGDLDAVFRRSAIGSADSTAVLAEVRRVLGPTGKAAHLIDATHRTESMRLYSHAAGARIGRVERETGVVTKKRWIASLGARTRPTHRALNGATIPNGEHFNVGVLGAAAQVSYEEAGRRGMQQGTAAKGPHDGVLPAREVVNCRCTVGAVFET